MSYLPENGSYLVDNEFEEEIFPTLTYRVDLENNIIRGRADDLESMKQVIYFALRTERDQYPIYSSNYGSELDTVFGMPTTYAIPEIQRIIKETLEWDTRIELVDNFQFEMEYEVVKVTFMVHTIYGNLESGTEVII